MWSPSRSWHIRMNSKGTGKNFAKRRFVALSHFCQNSRDAMMTAVGVKPGITAKVSPSKTPFWMFGGASSSVVDSSRVRQKKLTYSLCASASLSAFWHHCWRTVAWQELTVNHAHQMERTSFQTTPWSGHQGTVFRTCSTSWGPIPRSPALQGWENGEGYEWGLTRQRQFTNWLDQTRSTYPMDRRMFTQ